MVTGVFDIPYEKDFTINFDKGDVTYRKIHDFRTGNTHLFIDLGSIESGTSVITATINGIQRIPENPELVKDNFAAMYFGDHAYLRCTDKETAIAVTIPAPKGAYLRLISGKRIYERNGILAFPVNACWEDESAILYNYDKKLLEQNLPCTTIRITGPTTCSRWSGQ